MVICMLQFYSSGVFSSSYCSTYDVNHAMLVIGYGTSRNSNGVDMDYWILKNRYGYSTPNPRMGLIALAPLAAGGQIGARMVSYG